MLQFSLNEYDGNTTHLGVVGTDLRAGASPGHVAHLVFVMRFLKIGAALRQNIDPGAHGGNAEEFEVASRSLASQIVDAEEAGH